MRGFGGSSGSIYRIFFGKKCPRSLMCMTTALGLKGRERGQHPLVHNGQRQGLYC